MGHVKIDMSVGFFFKSGKVIIDLFFFFKLLFKSMPFHQHLTWKKSYTHTRIIHVN